MSEWREVKRYNPVGPDYPEAGRDYVLREEAEEKIAELEAQHRELCKFQERAIQRAEAAEAKLRAVGELPRHKLEADLDGCGNPTVFPVVDQANGGWIRVESVEALLDS